MLNGKQFQLRRDTLAIETLDNRRMAVKIPSGAIIRVISGPTGDDGLVKAHWGTRVVELFAVDVAARGVEIRD